MRKLKIFLADLVHNRSMYEYGFPLNIGLIASVVKEKYGNQVELVLFKFADHLIESLDQQPDIVAFSNYDWNVSLNRTITSLVHETNSNILTVMGGPNIRKHDEGVREFLLSFPDVDIYMLHEGEEPFCKLIEHVLSVFPCDLRKSIIDDANLPNSAFLSEAGSLVINRSCELSQGNPIPYPSPWLNGLLDPFLNLKEFPLSPIIETNRGCPYQCTFCTWGAFENRKVRVFDFDVAIEELRYIFSHTKDQFRLQVADGNFGILQRDILIAEEIRRLADKHKNMVGATIALSKDTFSRNKEICMILGDYVTPGLGIQSFDLEVLKNAGRKNAKVEVSQKFVKDLEEKGKQIFTYLLIGLPGETKESHIESVKKAFDLGSYKQVISDIRTLAGSEMDEADYRVKHGIQTMFRVIPSAYGEYGKRKAIEYEECIRATNSMTEDDFLSLRLFHGYLLILCNFELGRPFLEFIERYGLHPVDLIAKISSTPPKEQYPLLHEAMDFYKTCSRNEWFPTREEADAWYLQEEVFKEITEKGFPKLNYDLAAKLIINSPLREELFDWMVFHAEKSLDNVQSSVVREVAGFCSQRLACFPMKDSSLFLNISASTLKELENYITHEQRESRDLNSQVRIKLGNSGEKIRNFNSNIELYGGNKNLSLAIQTFLNIDNQGFVLASSEV